MRTSLIIYLTSISSVEDDDVALRQEKEGRKNNVTWGGQRSVNDEAL